MKELSADSRVPVSRFGFAAGTANVLNGLRSNLSNFSERSLTNNASHVDFDSAIPNSRNPLRPSQRKASRVKQFFVGAVSLSVVHSEFLFRSVRFLRRLPRDDNRDRTLVLVLGRRRWEGSLEILRILREIKTLPLSLTH
jgi:hypothetical protein